MVPDGVPASESSGKETGGLVGRGRWRQSQGGLRGNEGPAGKKKDAGRQGQGRRGKDVESRGQRYLLGHRSFERQTGWRVGGGSQIWEFG